MPNAKGYPTAYRKGSQSSGSAPRQTIDLTRSENQGWGRGPTAGWSPPSIARSLGELVPHRDGPRGADSSHGWRQADLERYASSEIPDNARGRLMGRIPGSSRGTSPTFTLDREAARQAIRRAQAAKSLFGRLGAFGRAASTLYDLVQMAEQTGFSVKTWIMPASWHDCVPGVCAQFPVNRMEALKVLGATNCGVMGCPTLQASPDDGNDYMYKFNDSRLSIPQIFGQTNATGSQRWRIQVQKAYSIGPGVYRWNRTMGGVSPAASNQVRPVLSPGHFTWPETFAETVTARQTIGQPPPAHGPPLGRVRAFPRKRPSERRKSLAQRLYKIATGVWDKADELRQNWQCIYGAIPAKCRKKHGNPKGILAQAPVLVACADSLDVGKMLRCMAWNHYSDKIFGRAQALPRRGQALAQRHGFAHSGRPGWGSGIGL